MLVDFLRDVYKNKDYMCIYIKVFLPYNQLDAKVIKSVCYSNIVYAITEHLVTLYYMC